MKNLTKVLICFILIISLAFMPGVTGYQTAQAGFVPFIIENAEWLLGILAAFGIAFSTEGDALAGVHDFAYNLDQSAYNYLQNYIEGQKLKNATGLYIGDLLTGGVLTDIYDYVQALPITLAAAGGQLLIDYLTKATLEGVVNGDFKDYQINLPSSSFSFNFVVPEVVDTWIILAIYGSYHISIRNGRMLRYHQTDQLILEPGIHNLKLIYENGSTYFVLDNIRESEFGSVLFSSLKLNNLEGLINSVDDVQTTISHLLKRNDGISIDENIGALPLPGNSESIDSPYDNTVIEVPNSISEGIGLLPHDVLYTPSIDSFGNTRTDENGTPIFVPVPGSWPLQGQEGNPPWELSPDIPGVATGVEGIGGILEGIRDNIYDLGKWITTSIPLLFTTTIPNLFPEGEPDNTDKMNDFKLPDLFFLFLGVILAVIRLVMRFVIFLGQLLLAGPNSSMMPTEMIQGLEFLKNQNISYVNVSAYTLISGLGSFLFGLSVIKMSIKFVTNLHTGSNLIGKYDKTMEKMDKIEKLEDRR